MNQTFRGGLALHRLVEDAPLDLPPPFLGFASKEVADEAAQLRAALYGHLGEADPVSAFSPTRAPGRSSALQRKAR